jgi:A/G-specific adenine glycosylase
MFSNEAEALMARADDFRRDLHAWYDSHHRLLPWRDRPSVYKTVVSEFMCQQTQVDTVLPYFGRWMAAWPDFKSLAEADEATVMRAWEGLGYYSRARRLHALAKEVAAMPEPPRTADGWIALPGVGAYTAAAVASISFGDPVAVVDGNVVRVISRLVCDERTFKDNGAAVKAVDPLAQAMVDPVFPGDFNQAMMELGATVCYRRNPLCALCPVREYCAAEKRGVAGELPKFLPKVGKQLTVDRLLVRDKSGALLLRRYAPDSPTLSGLCELPSAEGLLDASSLKEPVAVKKRTIANRTYTESIFAVKPTAALLRKVVGDSGLFWASPGELATVTLSGPHRKWLGELTSL